ncbi:VOC family protein [Roseibium sp. SCPC15]|uniref:VOC family protein n=1 Tax=Roseibium sp. SCP15 TaxID=3141376 RepID=UPI00333A4C78
MHKSRLGDLVIDCEGGDIDDHASFWAGALGRTVEAKPKNPRYRRLEGKAGEMGILLQSVEHPSRVHLDIETDDPEKEVARLEKLGAKIVQRFEHWVVMEATSGHRFCVVDPQAPEFERSANIWES